MRKGGSTYTYPSLLWATRHYERDFEVDKEELMLRQTLAPNTEQEICVHFSCGRVLTLEERLCGNKCHDHQRTVEVDVTKFISY